MEIFTARINDFARSFESLNKRSILKISADALRIAKDGTGKTSIIRKLSLNFKIGEMYLDQLRSVGLIGGTLGLGNRFVTTYKGFKYTLQFESLKSYLEKP
jgi:predicted transcriptional regulator